MNYIGEHSLIGEIGHLLVCINFVFCTLASISFFISSINSSLYQKWIKLSRISFFIHVFSVLGIISCLFIMIKSHYFEYQYVWQHSSLKLPTKYMISCFWEGQEGSFLLWIFWNFILGLFLIFKNKDWEAPLLTVISLIQSFLGSMLLGIYIFNIKIGSSPFTLIRNLEENINLPWTKLDNYIEIMPQFIDGRGLNPLLQNYWMVIHPPILFLGFSISMIPFCYAIVGLWKKKYSQWIKFALPWTYFAISILGTGILMGGAWAYESLSFGGFWAWDPVENSSLVPWIILVSSAHLMHIYRAKKIKLRLTFLITLLSFILVLYSSYLTRSGILGDTSVHAFAGGLGSQLLFFLIFVTISSFIIFLLNLKYIPNNKKEEHYSSREFWMFIGISTLLISAFQITWFTSIPVINKVFGTSMAPPIEIINLYNSWQIPLAIIIVLLIGLTQFLNYTKTNFKSYLNNIFSSIIFSIIVSLVMALNLKLWHPIYFILLFSCCLTTLLNIKYWKKIITSKFYFPGSSIAHIGFSLVIMGALVSNAKKNIISNNKDYIHKDFPQNENIYLEKGDTTKMDKYYVLYKSDSLEGINKKYEIEYFNKNKMGQLEYLFTLNPFIQLNNIMGNVAEPSTKHFLLYDVYSHLTFAETDEKDESNPYHHESIINLNTGDSIIYDKYFFYLDSLLVHANTKIESDKALDVLIIAKIRLKNIYGETFSTDLIYAVKDNVAQSFPGFIDDNGLKYKFIFSNVESEIGGIQIKAYEHILNDKPFIIMKAIIFPYINILWLGSILMGIGTLISFINLLKKQKID